MSIFKYRFIYPKNEQHCRHLSFISLIPFSVINLAILNTEYQDLERMIQCKSQFDMAIMRCRGFMQDGDISVDGVIINGK